MSTIDSSRLLGGVEEQRTASSTRFECRFLSSTQEASSLIPKIGDQASWAPEKAYITNITKTWLANGMWMVTLRAEKLSSQQDLSSIGIHISGLNKETSEEFDVGEIFFPPEWFGCRIAGVSDCTPFEDTAQTKIRAKALKYKNISDAWANPGDWIALNAVPLFCDEAGTILQSASKGTLSYAKSPFTGTIPDQWMGQTIQTRIYRCRFHSASSFARIHGFCGVNGSFGNGCNPGSSGSGNWKALRQNVKRVKDSDGKSYTRVDRSMIEAPGSLKWDASKNGGTWKW